MSITTISKHLPAALRYLCSPNGPRILDLIHLVESARYHHVRFEELTSGIGQAPDNFESGLEIEKFELDHYYRFMGSFIELESFFFAVKRFFDHSWCCIGEPFGKGAEKIRTLSGAIYNMQRHVKDMDDINTLKSNHFHLVLKDAYERWGEKSAKIRNFIEHVAPLGGNFNNYKITVINGKQCFDPFMPDKIPDKGQNIFKEHLTYKNEHSFTAYVRTTMQNLDDLLAKLLTTEEP